MNVANLLQTTPKSVKIKQPKLTASLLCADALKLGEELDGLSKAGIDYLHVDMADGHFVPLLGIGIEEARQIRKSVQIPFDVHLLVSNPDAWVPRVLNELSPAIVTFQAEATAHGYHLAQLIRQKGASAGVAINPGTPISAIEYLLPTIDVVLVMTTNPGFVRQTLIDGMVEKISDLKRLIDAKDLDIDICVDGNVNFQDGPRMLQAGAGLFVCGSSSVFDRSYDDIVAATDAFRLRLDKSAKTQTDGQAGGNGQAVLEDGDEQAGNHRFHDNSRRIVAEIGETLDQVDADEVDSLATELIAARRVFIIAVGRVMMSLQCLGKRLGHLGIDCQVVGSMDEKPIGPEDLLMVASGSGESKLPVEIARISKSKDARLALITSASRSTIKSMSDVVVHLPCPTKMEPTRGVQSIQLMSTLFDQSLHIFGDVLALEIQRRKNLTSEAVWQQHANLE